MGRVVRIAALCAAWLAWTGPVWAATATAGAAVTLVGPVGGVERVVTPQGEVRGQPLGEQVVAVSAPREVVLLLDEPAGKAQAAPRRVTEVLIEYN